MKPTQNEMIRKYLSEGNGLTALEALRLFGCSRLAARINEIREQGFPVDSELVEVETRHGETARVARYTKGVSPYLVGQRELFAAGYR